MGYDIVAGNGFLKFCFVMFLFPQKLFIGLLSKQLGKGFFIRSQKICHPSQFKHYHLLGSICSDIVSAGTVSSVIHLIVGTHEIVNVLVDCVRMVTELAVAVSAEQQITKYAFLAVFRFWRTAFGFGYERLYLFKIAPCNNRLVNILEYCPILGIVRKSCFVFKRL